VDEVKLKTAQLYDFELGNELMPSIDEFSSYTRDLKDGSYKIKNELLQSLLETVAQLCNYLGRKDCALLF
jgi:hypothetical protein